MISERAAEFRLRRVYAWPFQFEELQSPEVVGCLQNSLYYTARIMERFPKPKKHTPAKPVEVKKEGRLTEVRTRKVDINSAAHYNR